MFNGGYLGAIGSGTSGNTRGALWKQEVLAPTGASFVYTGLGTAALAVPNADARLWNEGTSSLMVILSGSP